MPTGLDSLFTSNNYIGHFGYQCSTVPTNILMYMQIYMHVHYVNLELRTGGFPIRITTLPTFVLFDPPLIGILACLPL